MSKKGLESTAENRTLAKPMGFRVV